MKNNKRILISNGRLPWALHLTRMFSAAGHEVIVTETQTYHISRFSNAVTKSFKVSSPRFEPEKHIQKILEIVRNEKIDLFIPSWEDIFVISKHLDLFPDTCLVFSDDFNLLLKLHHKSKFIEFQKELGIDIPESIIISSKEELKSIHLKSYALKPCFSRGSNRVYNVTEDDTLPNICPTPQKPWIAQTWLEGKNFCTHSICHDGKVFAHSFYPMEMLNRKKRKGSNSDGTYCLTFRPCEHPKIKSWIENFVQKIHFTGQIAFDFIELPSGEIFAIDCNPRLTSGITLFDEASSIEKAFLKTSKKLITPSADVKTQISAGMLMYGWRYAIENKDFKTFFKNLFGHKDVIFHREDLKPFFLMPIIWIGYIADAIKYRMDLPSVFTHDLDYNG